MTAQFFSLPAYLGSLLALANALPLFANAERWTIIQKEGADYVTIRNIYEFYEFEESDESLDKKRNRLIHPSITLDFDIENAQGLVVANGVKFQLLNPFQWDEDKREILLRTEDLMHIVDPIIRPSRKFRPAEKDLVRISVQDPPPGFRHAKLEAAIIHEGWKISRNIEEVVALNLQIHFLPHSKVEPAPAVKTNWMRGIPTPFGVQPKSDQHSLFFATALHSRLKLALKAQDYAVVPMKPGLTTNQNYPGVKIQLHLPKDFNNWKQINEAIATALKSESEFCRKPRD